MLRVAAPRDVVLIVCALALPVIPAGAQDNAAPQEVSRSGAVSLLDVASPPKRPPALVPLYVSFAGLEALDIHSTYRALHTPGARESNPVARTIVDSPAAFTAIKLATSASFVLATEKMWKNHRVAALAFAAAGNAAMAAIVAHNYRLPGR
jgi:hypothetical protein